MGKIIMRTDGRGNYITQTQYLEKQNKQLRRAVKRFLEWDKPTSTWGDGAKWRRDVKYAEKMLKGE